MNGYDAAYEPRMSGSDQQTKSVAPNSAVAVGPFLAHRGVSPRYSHCRAVADIDQAALIKA